MSHLSKILLAVAVVALLIASYQANEASRLLTENRHLERKAMRLIVPVSLSPHHRTRRSRESGGTRQPNAYPAVEEALVREIRMADQGLHEYHVDYFLMEEGKPGVSAKAAKAAGLTDAEEKRVSGILMEIWNDAAGDFASRAELVEEESEEKAGRLVYMIPARADRGWALKDELLGELGDAVGPGKRAILMSGYQSNRFFGGFGAYDVRLEFTAGESKFSFSYLNPLDGEPNCFGSDPLEHFSDRFGNS